MDNISAHPQRVSSWYDLSMDDSSVHITLDKFHPEDLDVALKLAPTVVLSVNAYADLRESLKSDEAAIKLISERATAHGKPIAVNFPRGTTGESLTSFIPPRGWTQEQLEQWVADHKGVFENAFGEASKTYRPSDSPLP